MGKKIVLVTGANKGIGFGIAKHLGLSDWQVIIGARDEQRASKAIEELKSQNVEVLGWVNIELKDLASIDKAVQEIKEKYPELYASLMSEATDAAKAAQSKAVKDAVDAEDERIKAIDEIASMCTPEMVQEAKYGEHKCSADTLALRAIKAQKEVQTQMSKNIVEDVKNSGANDVHALGNGGNEPVKPESMEDEVTNIVNKIKEAKK